MSSRCFFFFSSFSFFKNHFFLLLSCWCVRPQIRSNIIFARRLRPNFNSSIPDWLHPLNYYRLACLSLPLTLQSPHSSHYVFFPLHDFISLLYFFIHETGISLSLIICLIPTLLFFLKNKQQVNIHPEAGPCTSFHILLENQFVSGSR